MVNQQESIQSDEQLDEALDEFERGWSAEPGYLQSFAAGRELFRHPQALSELVRADIDRRYAIKLEVDLPVYFKLFPELTKTPRLVAAIGFEDFRSRRSRGLLLPPQRWGWMPGISQASWYKGLCDEAVNQSGWNSVLSDLAGIAKRCNHQSEAPQASSNSSGDGEPKVGDRFGEFQLLAVLGKGAFSTVYLASQLGLASRYVALKVVRRPLNEPTHLARLQHTGIVPLFSLHRLGPFSALCMPYFGSATLADWMSNSSYPSRDGQSLVGTVQSAQLRLTTVDNDQPVDALHTREIENVRVWNSAGAQPLDKLRSLNARQFVLWLAQRLTAALAHAHERGVIHGDLKPANILLRNDGEPALIDFNLSKNVERESDAWTGGTLPYMAPEQLQCLLGQATQIDASADVYSLGIILYELVENRAPFPRPMSPADSDIKLAFDSRNTVAEITSTTATEGLKAIIRKCLQPTPSARYASAIPLLEDVEREVANLPLLHARERLLQGRIPKLMRRYPRLFSAGPIAMVSLLVIGLLASIATVTWRESKRLAAEAHLAQFRVAAKDLLAEMLEPAPAQWESLLASSNQLIAPWLTTPGQSAAGQHAERLSVALEALAPQDREAARRDLFEFCLTAVALTCSSNSDLDAAHRERLSQLLSLCTELSDSSHAAPLVAGLQEIVSAPVDRLPTRYEALMRTLEEKLDRNNADTAASAFLELLQARSDVRQGQARQAMERLRQVEIGTAEAPLFWMVSGDAQSQLGQPEAAAQAYGLAIGAAPKSAAAYVKRAQVLQSMGDFKSAESDYSRAIALAPATSSLLLRRALVREELHDFDAAIEDMDAALELEPKSNRLLFVRARLHQRAQHRESYRDDYRSGLSLTPQSLDDWISRALAHLPRYPEKAKADLQQALRIDPSSLVVLQNLAHVESEHFHDLPAAMTALDQILQTSPDNEAARAGRSVVLARLGRSDECLQDLETLTKQEPKLLPSTLYQMGCAYALASAQHPTHADSAVRLLAQALRRGYGAEILATDPDLDSVRERPAFAALLTIAGLIHTN